MIFFKKCFIKRTAITIILLIISLISSLSHAENGCVGRFVNPITDICWSCLFPLTIGSMTVYSNGNPDTKNPSNPLCVCKEGVVPRIGITLGYWEPSRLVDVTRHPFCFVSLGGIIIKIGDSVSGTGTVNSRENGDQDSTYQVHWYIYPLIYWLNLITDAICVEKANFDVAYITELDPTWNDDELAFVLNPEAVLFANPVAQASCAADCAAASSHLPMDSLFWCSGCQGSMYPLTGHVQDQEGDPQGSELLVERMTFKMHRMGLLWGTYGGNALCHEYPMPIMDKSMYRTQMVYPRPITSSPLGCNPYGRTTTIWGAGHAYPIKGEDFGYLVWRKRNCCAF
jgi:conjugal transfer pilus assembly protein TraU